MHQELLTQGYRIIGVSRAWFGASSPPKDSGNILENNAKDLVALLDELALEQVTLLGNMSGSIHALVTAALFPKRIKRVINIAGMVPLTHDSQISSMPKSVKRLVRTAKYFPLLLPLLMRTAIAVIDKGDIRQLFETAYKNSPLDYALLAREDIRQRLSRGYLFAANHGYLAYTHEGIAIATDTSQYIEKVNCPLCIIHGGEDSVNSTKSIIQFSKTIENTHLSIIKDAGHLMMYAIPKTLTNVLIERLNKHE
jgi:pimeloyl-ACP methyl ester carboxylesterase